MNESKGQSPEIVKLCKQLHGKDWFPVHQLSKDVLSADVLSAAMADGLVSFGIPDYAIVIADQRERKQQDGSTVIEKQYGVKVGKEWSVLDADSQRRKPLESVLAEDAAPDTDDLSKTVHASIRLHVRLTNAGRAVR